MVFPRPFLDRRYNSDSVDISPIEFSNYEIIGNWKNEEMNVMSTSGRLILQFSHHPRPVHSLPNHYPYEFPPVERMTHDFSHV
jgi:hypothetical protein